MPDRGEFTRLLADLNAGEEGAEEALLVLVYDELRSLARRYMLDERSGHTLQTTAVVHEAYVRLSGMDKTDWESKAHYFRVAARAMRRVLIDHARRKKADKHGGNRQRKPLELGDRLAVNESVDLLDLDLALKDLSEMDPRMGQIVELRFFGGLTIEDTARVLGVSSRTVKNDWKLAKSWLKEEMN